VVEQFRDKHYQLFSKFLNENYGVNYHKEKADMLQTKIKKLMLRNNITSFDEYYELISGQDSFDYLTQFLEDVTTHTTNFFRENSHFDYLKKNLNNILYNNKRIMMNKEIRVWSAACSTGEEPYTLGMVLNESLPENINIKILATDISRKSIVTAAKGNYSAESVEKEMGKYYMRKYFTNTDGMYQVENLIKEQITFRIFNLMELFKFKKGFDIIFCRNVMIYFEPKIQTRLIDKIYDVLVPGGLLFIGHSEGLVYKEHKFKYIQPTVYLKG
jgi:chemotaxis protein methyltransferase CheR